MSVVKEQLTSGSQQLGKALVQVSARKVSSRQPEQLEVHSSHISGTCRGVDIKGLLVQGLRAWYALACGGSS